ncbi:CCL26 protein, partial [Dryoscopus gambensis]|nr:CCL26 protein [Dryoscopus gambensis]
MKISLALLVLLLAAAYAGMTFRSSKVTCCSEKMFYHQKIRESRIQEYKYTPPTCALKAVLVTVPEGTICVDPKKRWFQQYLRKQKKPNSTS